MKDMIELVGLYGKRKPRVGENWGVLLEPGSKMEQLFEAISAGELSSDEEAAALLYPDSKRIPTKYYSVRNSLKDRLVDSVFLADNKEPSRGDRQEHYYESYRKWAAAMVLLSRNAKIVGVEVMEKLLRQTEAFEFTELTLDILRTLRLHYSTVAGDLKRYDQLNAAYHQYQQIWAMENRAEELYTGLTVQYVNSKSTKPEVTALAETYYAEIAPMLAESSAFKLHLCGRLIEVAMHSSRNDYVRTAAACEDAIAFFGAKPYQSGLSAQVFYYQLVVCYLQLKEFEKGRKLVETYQELFANGSFNWFKLQELYFLLAMHTTHYVAAAEVLLRVLGHPKFDSQPAHITEMWKIYEAFVAYLERIGMIDAGALAGTRFRVHKFLNDIPVFSRDKRGMNIPILIVQLLFTLSGNDYDQAVDRIEAIEKYCSRYLKRDDTYRSNLFIKMLLQIPQASFHSEGVSRKVAPLLAALRESSLEIANQTHEIEIIPYENLWELVFNHLGRQFHPVAGKRKPGASQ